MESDKPAIFSTLWQDVRFGARILRRSPGITAVIVLALAAGIGANSAMFSVVDTMLLHRLHYEKPDDLSVVFERNTEGQTRVTSAGKFLDWRNANSFSGMAAVGTKVFVMQGGDHAMQLRGMRTTANLFDVLGVKPILGNTFVRGQDGLDGGGSARRVAVISYSLWRDGFGLDPTVLGRPVRLNGDPFDIIGVMPKDFEVFLDKYQVWVPADLTATNRDFPYLVVVARRKVPQADAAAEVRSIARRVEAENPRNNRGWTPQVEGLEEWLVDSRVRTRLLMLFAAVGLVLLLACSNVASLLLTRSASRSRELALRVALGATRWRVVRQLLIEGLLLSLAGGVLGLVVAGGLIRLAPAVMPVGAISAGTPLELSPLVIEFTLGVSLLTGLLFGVAPAVAASRPDVQELLRDSARGATGGRGRKMFRQAMVTLQVAVAVALLSGAALMVRSMQRLYEADLGVKTESVLTQRIYLPPTSYDAQRSLRFHREVLERVKAIPGVTEAAMGSQMPLTLPIIEINADPAIAPVRPAAEMNSVVYTTSTPGYFHVLGIPMIQGRDFADTDSEKAPSVAVVNQAFAKRFFADGHAVGQRLRVSRPILGTNSFAPVESVEIVGIVGNVAMDKIGAPPYSMIYAPMAQNVWTTAHWLSVRAKGDAGRVMAEARGVIADMDRDLPLDPATSMGESLASQFAEPKFQSDLMSGFSLLALGLALVGIYSVNAYIVSQRARELGVRLALGAPSSWVMREILAGGLKLTLAGLVLGLGAAVMLNKVLASALVDVGEIEIPPLAAASLLLVITSALACCLPAWRATRIDPAIALRAE